MKKTGYISLILVLLFFFHIENNSGQSYFATIGSGFNLMPSGTNLNYNFPTIFGGVGSNVLENRGFVSLEMGGRNVYPVGKNDNGIIKSNFSNIHLHAGLNLKGEKAKLGDAMIGGVGGMATSNERSYFICGLFVQGNLNIPVSGKYNLTIFFRPSFNYFNLADPHPQLICNLSGGLSIRKKK